MPKLQNNYTILPDGRKVKVLGFRMEEKLYEALVAQSGAEHRSLSTQAAHYIAKGLEADGYDIG